MPGRKRSSSFGNSISAMNTFLASRVSLRGWILVISAWIGSSSWPSIQTFAPNPVWICAISLLGIAISTRMGLTGPISNSTCPVSIDAASARSREPLSTTPSIGLLICRCSFLYNKISSSETSRLYSSSDKIASGTFRSYSFTSRVRSDCSRSAVTPDSSQRMVRPSISASTCPALTRSPASECPTMICPSNGATANRLETGSVTQLQRTR